MSKLIIPDNKENKIEDEEETASEVAEDFVSIGAERRKEEIKTPVREDVSKMSRPASRASTPGAIYVRQSLPVGPQGLYDFSKYSGSPRREE